MSVFSLILALVLPCLAEGVPKEASSLSTRSLPLFLRWRGLPKCSPGIGTLSRSCSTVALSLMAKADVE
jgi:hypothetical protein